MSDFMNQEGYIDQGTTMSLLPLRDVVVFPHMIVPLFVGRERSIAALESAMRSEKGIFLVAQKNAQKDEPAEEDIYRVGTVGMIINFIATVGVTLMTPAPPEHLQDLVEHVRIPRGAGTAAAAH